MRRITIGVGLLGALCALSIAAIAGADSGNKYASETDPRDCGDDNTVTFTGAKNLWPPNHKMQTVTITATDNDADPLDDVSLSTTAVHDEVGLNGAGNPTLVDTIADPPSGMNKGTGSTSVDWQLRSERSGRGDGRLYTIMATATFDNGTDPCDTQTFEVTVPHDQRGGAGWL